MAMDLRNRRKQSSSMPNARTVCTTALSTGWSEVPASRSAKNRSPSSLRAAARSPAGAPDPRSSTMSSAWRQNPYRAWTWWRLIRGSTNVDQ
jgi:hypothetical protein